MGFRATLRMSEILDSLESRFPSPWPSPSGRGEALHRLLGVRPSLASSPRFRTSPGKTTEQPMATLCNEIGEEFSLPPRERAGVRGKEPTDNRPPPFFPEEESSPNLSPCLKNFIPIFPTSSSPAESST